MQIPHIVRNADHELLAALQQPQAISLVGPAGSGRTALIERTLRRLETTGASGVRVACRTIGGATHVAVRLALESDFGPPPGEMASWDALLAWMQERSGGPIALVFDDADTPNDEATAFMDAAQRWIASNGGASLRVAVVTHCFAGLDGFRDKVVRIEPFGIDAAEPLARAFRDKADPEAWARAVLGWTGGYAAHTLRMVQELYDDHLEDGVAGDAIDRWVESELMATGRARRQYFVDAVETVTSLVRHHQAEGALARYQSLLEGDEHAATLDSDARLLVSAGLAVWREDDHTLELTSRLQREVLGQAWVDELRIALAGQLSGPGRSSAPTTAPLPAMTEDLRRQIRSSGAGPVAESPTPLPRRRPQTFSGAPISDDAPVRESTSLGLPQPPKEQTWDAPSPGGGVPSLDWDLDPSDFPDPESWGFTDEDGPIEFNAPAIRSTQGDEAPDTEDLEPPDTLDDPQGPRSLDRPMGLSEDDTLDAPFGAADDPHKATTQLPDDASREKTGTIDAALPSFGTGPATHEAPALPVFDDEDDAVAADLETSEMRRPETIAGVPFQAEETDDAQKETSTTLKIQLPAKGSKTLAGFQVRVGDLPNIPRRPAATPLDTDDPLHSKALVSALSTDAAKSDELRAVAPATEEPPAPTDALEALTRDATAPETAPEIIAPEPPKPTEPFVQTGGSGTLAMPALALGRRDGATPEPVPRRGVTQDPTHPGIPEGATPIAGQPVVTSGANRQLERREAAAALAAARHPKTTPMAPVEAVRSMHPEAKGPSTFTGPPLSTETEAAASPAFAEPLGAAVAPATPAAEQPAPAEPTVDATPRPETTAPVVEPSPSPHGPAAHPALQSPGAPQPRRTPRLTPSDVLRVQAGPPEATLQPARPPSTTPMGGQPLTLRMEPRRRPWLLYLIIVALAGALAYQTIQLGQLQKAINDTETAPEE